jgi:hypothetical protein
VTRSGLDVRRIDVRAALLGHRTARVQPLGGLLGSGTSPLRAAGSVAWGSATGIASMSARV